jgi:hypothetical protein
MNVDLHRVLARKQERECAKADDFAFKARARAVSRFGEWLRRQDIDVDSKPLARRVAMADDITIFEALLAAHGGDRRIWSRAFDHARAQAAAELRAELGDPSPYRLA